MPRYTQTEIVRADVTIITTVQADNLDEAKAKFDNGEWEARSEEIGDIHEVIERMIREEPQK